MPDVVVAAGSGLVDGLLTGEVTLVVADGTVSSVGEPADGPTTADLTAAVVVPGLIDVHTHGAAGVQVLDGPAADLERLSLFYAAHGVSGYLATVGGDPAQVLTAVAALRRHLDGAPTRGARCLGIHLEGPFISPEAPGAFRPESIRSPDVGLFAEVLDAAGGHLRLVTLAPELPGAAGVIDLALAHAVTCSAGHSAATTDDAAWAVQAGVRSVTHLFNAMGPFHHRDPGIVGVALTDPRLVCELVVDGVHVHPDAVLLAAREKGSWGIALVSDSIAATGLADGDYELEEQRVRVVGGEARLADGTLAGSTLTLDRAVANFADWAQLPWIDAVRSATEVPAALVGLDAAHGTIEVGRAADLAGFDEDGRLLWTMVAGDVYPAAPAVAS